MLPLKMHEIETPEQTHQYYMFSVPQMEASHKAFTPSFLEQQVLLDIFERPRLIAAVQAMVEENVNYTQFEQRAKW